MSHNPSTGPVCKKTGWNIGVGNLTKESALQILQGIKKPIDHHGTPIHNVKI